MKPVTIIPEAIDLAFERSKNPKACLRFLFAIAVQELIQPLRPRIESEKFDIKEGLVPNMFDPTQSIPLVFKPKEHKVVGVPHCHWNMWGYIRDKFNETFPNATGFWEEHGFKEARADEILDDWIVDIENVKVINKKTSEEVKALILAANAG